MAIKIINNDEILIEEIVISNGMTVYSQSDKRAGFFKIDIIKTKLNFTVRDYDEAGKYLKSRVKT